MTVVSGLTPLVFISYCYREKQAAVRGVIQPLLSVS